jgi:hypothetical protein
MNAIVPLVVSLVLAQASAAVTEHGQQPEGSLPVASAETEARAEAARQVAEQQRQEMVDALAGVSDQLARLQSQLAAAAAQREAERAQQAAVDQAVGAASGGLRDLLGALAYGDASSADGILSEAGQAATAAQAWAATPLIAAARESFSQGDIYNGRLFVAAAVNALSRQATAPLSAGY